MEKIIKIKAIAGSKKPGISIMENGVVKVKVSSPPEKGKANDEIKRIIAKASGIKERDVELLSGFTSAEKTIKIKNGGSKNFLKFGGLNE